MNEGRAWSTDVRAPESGAAVAARGLERVYRRGSERIHALKAINLAVAAGEFVGVVGHSGAGKTTLLNLIGLMDRPTRGELALFGQPVSRRELARDALRRANVGFVFQDFHLLPTLTALENVLLPGLWAGRDACLRGRARALLERVGLAKRMTHRPGELSGGEMQRVAVARALVNSPRLLLADEPTGNLDTRTRDEILELLRELNGRDGLTVLFATHDRSLEGRFGRLVRLEDGNVVA
ncbi:MAG: ABC transporter ATP-binding protein [bacterium]